MSDAAEFITAGGGLLTAIGAAAAFIWNKIEKRFAEIDGELEKCHEREVSGQERRAIQRTVIELIWQEVERLAPDGNKVLARAKRLLDELKQTDRPDL